MDHPSYHETIHVGISSCVLGEKVRFNGGHKRNTFCADTLGPHVRFVPICPEMGIGLGTPRPSIRLVKTNDQIIARSETGNDISDAVRHFARKQATQLTELSGYIFCAKSPSCGMERVRVYEGDGQYYTRDGVGVYAGEMMRACPRLPVEEDGRLNDPVLRENFVTRMYAYHDWLKIMNHDFNSAKLVAFHTRYKYLLLAHKPTSYAALGHLISDLSEDLPAIADTYHQAFMETLKTPATREQHTNVLQHLQGYFKRQLTSKQRQELAQVIDQYRQSIVPLLAPITLIRHYASLYPNDYIAEQRYLNPYPETLGLRYSL